MGALNFDSNGLLRHANGDPGDQLADTCRYVFGTWLNGDPDHGTWAKVVYYLIVLDGLLRRAPDTWTDPCDCGQDQQDPFIIAAHAMEDWKTLAAVERRHQDRSWRYQTVHWATSQQRNYYTPVLNDRRPLGDIWLLLGAVVRVIDSYLWPETSVGRDQNYMMALIQVWKWGHSPATRLAVRIYRWRRHGPAWALEYYYRNDNPGIAALWAPHLEKMLGE